MTDNRKLKILLKDCAKGFYQQMYFWGKDVTHPKGNQLQTYGFSKSPSKGLPGTSCYTHESEHGTVELYGSCAAFYPNHPDQPNIVFLRERTRFYQWISPEKLIAGLWDQEDLKAIDPATMLHALTPFLEWWMDYERWIEAHHGEPYRDKCYHEWSKVNSKLRWLKPQLARQWIEAFMKQKDQHIRPKHYA